MDSDNRIVNQIDECINLMIESRKAWVMSYFYDTRAISQAEYPRSTYLRCEWNDHKLFLWGTTDKTRPVVLRVFSIGRSVYSTISLKQTSTYSNKKSM
jgi:hypothetical protein